MFSGDENTFKFVTNQLMRMLGVKVKRKKREKKTRMTVTKTTTTSELQTSTIFKSKRVKKDSARAFEDSCSSPSPMLI